MNQIHVSTVALAVHTVLTHIRVTVHSDILVAIVKLVIHVSRILAEMVVNADQIWLLAVSHVTVQ